MGGMERAGCSARQRIRDFVRIKRWIESNASEDQVGQYSDADDEQDEQTKLEIYRQLLKETNYALPLITDMSTDMKKERLRNAYRACLISNEILKQLNHEAEVYTNITAVRHKVSGLLVYINRETRQEVPLNEYLQRYHDYLSHSKIIYEDPEELERMLEREEEEERREVEQRTESAANGRSIGSAIGDEADQLEEEDSRSSSETDRTHKDEPFGTTVLRKRCSSTASATDEANSIGYRRHSLSIASVDSNSSSGSGNGSRNDGSDNGIHSVTPEPMTVRLRSHSSPFPLEFSKGCLERSTSDGNSKKLRAECRSAIANIF